MAMDFPPPSLGHVSAWSAWQATRAGEAKFKELILFVAKLCASHVRFGALKLNKVLFYSDFVAYKRLGRSITGQEYFHLPKGPAPRCLKEARHELLHEKAATIEYVMTPNGHPEHRLHVCREPDLSMFSRAEIDLVRSVADTFTNLTGHDVSELSHEFVGWQLTPCGETIPYETALISREAPSLAEREFARGLPPVSEVLAGR